MKQVMQDLAKGGAYLLDAPAPEAAEQAQPAEAQAEEAQPEEAEEALPEFAVDDTTTAEAEPSGDRTPGP